MVRDLLMTEVESQLEALHELPVGSKEHVATSSGITQMMTLAAKIEQDEIVREDNLAVQTEELNLKEAQVEIQRKQTKLDAIIKGGQVAGTVLLGLAGLGLTYWGTKYCTDFEAKGVTQTTDPGKNFVKRMFRF